MINNDQFEVPTGWPFTDCTNSRSTDPRLKPPQLPQRILRLRMSGCCQPKNTQTTTPGKINMEPENGPLEYYFPLQPSGCQVPC